MPQPALLKTSRLIHLYFGVFITPALLFFAFTGAIQTFGLHETNRDHPNYVPARILVVLGQIHKKQTPIVPVRKPQPSVPNASPNIGPASSPDAAPKHDQKSAEAATSPEAAASISSGEKHERHRPTDPTAAPAASGPAPATPAAAPAVQPQKKHNPLPLRIFFLIVSIGLFTSTLTGLYMSYTYVRKKLLVTLTLLAGVALPLLLLLA